MTRAEDFMQKEDVKINTLTMSNNAWCYLNCKGDILKPHYKSPNPKCNCQKLISFTPRQTMLECNGFKNTMKKIFRGSQTTWKKFLKPALIIASPYIDMVVSAQTKYPKIGQATTIIWKSISGGKILSLTNMHGHRLRSKVV